MKRRGLKVAIAGLLAAVAFMSLPMTAMAGSTPTPPESMQLVSYQEAVKVAQAKYPKAKLVSLELDYDDGKFVYDMEFVNTNRKEYDLKVNAQTGKLIRNKYEGKLHSSFKLNQIKVSYEKAIATAQNTVPNYTFDKLEVDWVNKMPIYEIEFRTSKGTEKVVEVDAATGKINNNAPKDIITEAKAKQIAIKAAGGGKVVSIRLDRDDDDKDDDATYEVKVRTEDGWVCDVEINAYTGKVKDVDWDDDWDD